MSTFLPETSIGDVDYGDVDTGDIDTGDVSVQGLEGGDVLVEHGDFENGAPVRRRTTATALAQRAKNSPRHRRILAKVLQKTAAAPIRNATAVHDAIRARSLVYETADGAIIRSSTIGIRAAASSTELSAMRSLVYQLPPFDPQAVPLLSSSPGSPLTVNLSQALFSLAGLLPADHLSAPIVGVILQISAPVLDAVPGFSFSVNRSFRPSNSAFVTNTMLMETPPGVRTITLSLLYARLVAGHPRFTPAQIEATGSIGTPTDATISVAGLPANYIANVFFLQPGDDRASAVIGAL